MTDWPYEENGAQRGPLSEGDLNTLLANPFAATRHTGLGRQLRFGWEARLANYLEAAQQPVRPPPPASGCKRISRSEDLGISQISFLQPWPFTHGGVTGPHGDRPGRSGQNAMSGDPPSLAFAAAIALGLLASSAGALSAESDLLPYGPKAAMTVAISSRSGLDTDHAEITLDNAPVNSKGFCANSNGDDGQLCVGKTLADANIQSSILANCLTGKFTSPWGNGFRFIGRAASGDYYYIIQPDEVPHEVLDYRANYDVAIDAFKALCPARVSQADHEDTIPEATEELGPDDAEDTAPDVVERADTAPDVTLGDALDSIMGGPPVYVQFTCEITGTEVLGVPNFGGKDKVVTAEIGVRRDGTAIINGKLVQPAKVFPATAGADLPFNGVVYRALDVKSALFSTEGSRAGSAQSESGRASIVRDVKGNG
ncbi:MAG: hypothetical protein EOR01_23640 [Mesorhizobium sp.]|uniref:hypothetical protein n=1 Tax=Mesorhizobium sp. TaxID=1871066 RepID=UPI000FE48AE3|nr:hypothetical protein [Mesorhizobium sp.]RWP18016.1 MAG: hypothetical protein EOR01_23640 [Mesorhizobium sp.]